MKILGKITDIPWQRDAQTGAFLGILMKGEKSIYNKDSWKLYFHLKMA